MQTSQTMDYLTLLVNHNIFDTLIQFLDEDDIYKLSYCISREHTILFTCNTSLAAVKARKLWKSKQRRHWESINFHTKAVRLEQDIIPFGETRAEVTYYN